ncbi:MAG: glycosyltransferase family 2 protein [Candidatus Eremiobacteraeota bacterium]|nr:glycosyltransferase family 2 protein [Candidatus Eremiobacteraeota bacterium]
MERLSATYILPLRKDTDEELGQLTEYLERLSHLLDVIVVDNSNAELFARHHRHWRHLVTHIRPDDDCITENQKVGNVTTGVRKARTEALVVADDDVRYCRETLQAVIARLSAADIVRPANYFAPLVWHAAFDTARTLLNRISGGDWPGTLAFRKSAFVRAGGYAGNVLFENFELVRTIVRAGGREVNADDVFVKRLPPGTRHFWSQRVRQAYDEFARPLRLLFFLMLAPVLFASLKQRRWNLLVFGALTAIGAAEIGRRRHGGAQVFPMTCSVLAPLWLLERGICSWLALSQRVFFGGVSYNGGRIKNAAT